MSYKLLLISNVFKIDIINFIHLTSIETSENVMRDDKSSVQLRKTLVVCLMICLSDFTSSQAIDMMINCEKFVAENNCMFRVDYNCNYEKI